jgi:hypothetical protein
VIVYLVNGVVTFFVHLWRFAMIDEWRRAMLTHYFHKLTRSQLNKRAVKSLEFAMIAMLFAVVSLGALGGSGPNPSAAAVQGSVGAIQVASAK